MNAKREPRILVVTVNAWNSKVGDNTFPLLLSAYPKDKIASLFVRENVPDSPVCDQYFRISERKILSSILHRSEKTGEVVKADELAPKAFTQLERIYQNKSSFYYMKLIARELVWKLGKWRSKELDAFIDTFQPEIVIYEMSRYIHLNNIVKYIVERTGAKGIGCFWDDTFTYKQEKSIGYKVLRFMQRRNLKSLASMTTSFFSITPKTKREADRFFGIDSVILTKPVSDQGYSQYSTTNAPLRMLYTGNVGIGRLDTIKLIIETIAEDDRFFLDIYTNTALCVNEVQMLNTKNSCVHAAVTQNEVLELQKQADILLFVESLSDANKIARLSFSTKITDYYSAGRCILAVGNRDLAPIELMREADSAIVACSREEMESAIRNLNPERIREYARKAHEEGAANHSINAIRSVFYRTIEQCCP